MTSLGFRTIQYGSRATPTAIEVVIHFGDVEKAEFRKLAFVASLTAKNTAPPGMFDKSDKVMPLYLRRRASLVVSPDPGDDPRGATRSELIKRFQSSLSSCGGLEFEDM